MTLTKGLFITDLVSRVLVDVSDPDQKRWPSDQIVKFINEGLRELAREGAFRRSDLQVPSANTPYYTTFAEAARITRVEYDFGELTPTTPARLHADFGGGWQDQTGIPTRYIPHRGGVTLFPIPEEAGTTFTFAGVGDITEEEGGKVSGEGYTAALDGSSLVHFFPGDGNVTNAGGAAKNLRIDYTYFPRPSEAGEKIPSRYADGLVVYALMRCFSLGEIAEEVAKAQLHLAKWEAMKWKIISEAAPAAQSEESLFGDMEAR